jgi:hypothetical protein
MPPTRGPLWEFFHRGTKRNTAHFNKNHDDSRVADLIAVPRYADAMESEGGLRR